jgi:HlyD family secretion protein
MNRRNLVIALVLLAAATTALAWGFSRREATSDELVLYGNVDLRLVSLAFYGNERIVEVLVEEGARVRKGQVLARLDTSRLLPLVQKAEAAVAARAAVVERLRAGSRPEEIAQARANLDAAKADAVNARKQFERKRELVGRGAGSQQELDSTKATSDMADAKIALMQKTLDLAIAGPRREDIEQAEAQLRGDQADLAYLKRQLADAELVAPRDAIVRSRLMEAGEMASPQRPVFSLAIVDPKWVRAYATEPDLGKIKPGMSAYVTTDSFPDRRYAGWVGFISPVAEFTPKTVQTKELRTSLVYEVRVFVEDPSDELRLGMPATVHLESSAAAPVEPPK